MALERTIDIEIAYLTKEYLEKLEVCENKEQFLEIVEEFDTKKEALKKKHNISRFESRFMYEPWFHKYSGAFKWLVPFYAYDHPNCDLNIFPDILRQDLPDAMYSIAITHTDRLDWFKGSMITSDGKKKRSNNARLIKKVVSHCVPDRDYMYEKIYLGENVFMITKWFKKYDGNMYIFALRKLCFSFEQFANELENDLSGAWLRDFDITNIDLSKYNTEGLSSDYLKQPQIGNQNIPLTFDENNVSFKSISSITSEEELEKNEIANVKQTGISSRDKKELDSFSSKSVPFYYISDLHLCHILKKNNAFDLESIRSVIEGVVNDLWNSYLKYRHEALGNHSLTKFLFLGDVSSDHHIFELFLQELKKRGFWNVVFILGNHEYWDFDSIENAVEWYKDITKRYGYVCLHNELLLYNSVNKTISEEIISGKEIINKCKEEIVKLTENSRYIIVAGTGFAGCNDGFNSKNGLYKDCLGKDISEAREREIIESHKFEEIYSKIFDSSNERQVIICTHNPVSDWSFGGYCANWIYLSGHNHKNERKISKKVRLYADNQVGYSGKTYGLKYFSVESKNNIFEHYEDGIYEISGSQYQDFMDGRNISMVLNQQDDKIWMLKRNGYYMFMSFKFDSNNELGVCVFDGGRKKKLAKHLPEYYYENMPRVISLIEAPTVQYSKVTAKVSEYIKSFGGNGRIHGCIVDIDTLNHVYVNPYDLKITPYFAYDMNERLVFKDLGSLIESNCPELFDRYNKVLRGDGAINSIIKSEKDSKVALHDSGTYIYRESNLIKRFDLLRTDKILTSWIDLPDDKLLIEDYENSVLEMPLKREYFPVVVGTTNRMNCGLMATVIEDYGYKNITVQFEDGVIVKNKRKDKFRLGNIGYPKTHAKT